jgi:hypothetical protein
MSEQEQKLKASFEKLTQQGMRDIKFCFGSLQERTREQVQGSVSEVLAAILASNSEELPPIGDSHGRKAAKKA